MWAALSDDPDAPSTSVASYNGGHDRVSQQESALPALPFASPRMNPPLAAATSALFYAVVTTGPTYARLLAELRADFPRLA